MSTNGVGCPSGRKVRLRVRTTFREWDPHSLPEAAKRRKLRLALGATFNHLQPGIDHGGPVKTGVGEERGQPKNPGVVLGWQRTFIRFRGCCERCRIWEVNASGFNFRGNRR